MSKELNLEKIVVRLLAILMQMGFVGFMAFMVQEAIGA